MDPAEPDVEAYLKETLKFSCSRLITGVLLTLLLFILATQFVPAPYNMYILLMFALWKMIEMSLWAADRILGPPPQLPKRGNNDLS